MIMGKMLSYLRNPQILVNISGFLDLFGVSLILPLILPHVRNLGASPTVAGLFGSSYGAVQLFSSPVVGKWSDLIGRRTSLLVSLIVTGFGYGIMGLSSSLVLLFLARIPGGIFKHSQNISKSYLADINSKEKRSHAFGQFNSASSIGFIVGPMIGGHIAEWPGGFQIVGLLAAGVFLINAVMIWVFLPGSHVSPHPEISREDSVLSLKKLNSAEYSSNIQDMFHSFRSIHWSKLWDLFLIKFLLGFSVILFRSNFSLITKSQFDAPPRVIGYMTSYSGAVSTLCGLFVGKLSKYYENDMKLFYHMVILQVITLFCLSLSISLFWVVLWLCPLSIVTSVMRVTGTTLTIHRGEEQDRGALMGFSQSIMSIARMLAPFIGGVAMEMNPMGPACISTFVTVIALIILYVRSEDVHKQKVKQS